MKILLAFAHAVDRFTERLGHAVYWLSLFMVLIGAFNAVGRYMGRYIGADITSNVFIEMQWYMFGALFLLGASYTLKHDAHVRVDVLYGNLSKRNKTIINIAGAILFLLPFCILVQIVSWPAVFNSWHVWEQSPNPDGLPRYPIKTLIPIAFLLVTLQGLSGLIKDIASLRGIDPTPTAAEV